MQNDSEMTDKQQSSVSTNQEYFTGINGLRTIAVVGVILYHLMASALPGGFLGVPIFLALSGYLVINSFLKLNENGLNLDISNFYWRRLRRLYPALVVMLIFTASYITLFAHKLMGGLRGIIGSNLIYVYNFFEIKHGQSYFEKFNGLSPFTHLWTLSIEGQFYIVAPFLALLLIKVFKKRSRMFAFLLGISILSALWMAILFDQHANINRIYYGTDTRLFSILLGSALAIIWPSNHLNPNVGKNGKRLLNIIGFISLLLILLMYFTVNGTRHFNYNGGMFIFSLLVVVMIAVIVHPGSNWNRWLTNPIFDWIGKRSYGIYLYQFPVIVFYGRIVNIANHPWFNSLIEIIIILLISELSYRFIEQPLAHINSVNIKQYLDDLKHNLKHLITSAVVILMAIITLIGCVKAPTSTKIAANAIDKHIQKSAKTVDKNNEKLMKSKKSFAKDDTYKIHQDGNATAYKKLNKQQKNLAKKFNLSPSDVLTAQKMSITAIGDSILLDTSGDLQSIFGHAYVDAKVSRQAYQAPDIIKSIKAKGMLAHNVLINLGTNSPLTQDQVNNIIKAIGSGHNIFWVNTLVPTQNWQNEVNNIIAKNAKKRKHFYMIDWYSLSKKHNEWFGSDQIHPNPQGSVGYTNLIVKSMIKDLKN